MIRTEAGIKLTFKHIRNPGGCLDKDFEAVTTCYVVSQDDIDIGVGKAWCLAEDQFRKEIGRRIALTRALENSKLDKETRAMVWAAYLGRKSQTFQAHLQQEKRK